MGVNNCSSRNIPVVTSAFIRLVKYFSDSSKDVAWCEIQHSGAAGCR